MQVCDVEVRLAGDVYHTVPKIGVTPAEILILQTIHGSDAVVNIRPRKQDKRGHADEYDRLSRTYDGGSIHGAGPDDPKKVSIARLFPGPVKKLPVTLDEIGISITGEPLVSPDLADAA